MPSCRGWSGVGSASMVQGHCGEGSSERLLCWMRLGRGVCSGCYRGCRGGCWRTPAHGCLSDYLGCFKKVRFLGPV